MTANLIKAKGAAFRLHQEFKIKKPADIRVEDIAMAKNVLVLEAELDGAEARLIREGSMGLVRINSKIPEPGRKRFAASHELGHWQIHERGVYICTAADMADYQKSPREVEANAFAAEFLMPSFLFRPLCANKSPSLELVEELKIRFNTTLTATTFRMMDEISADCMMLLTKNRKVERWRKSPNCALPLFVETGSSLSPQSVAYHCQPNPVGIPKAEKVPLEAWLDPASLRKINPEDWVLWEQSMQLGSYPTILTILLMAER